MNFDSADRCIIAAKFLWCVVNIIETYSNCLCKYMSLKRYYAKHSTIININLTFGLLNILYNLVKNNITI